MHGYVLCAVIERTEYLPLSALAYALILRTHSTRYDRDFMNELYWERPLNMAYCIGFSSYHTTL